MKIVATYIMYSKGQFYKLHECSGVNSFGKCYYREWDNGLIVELSYEEGKKLIEDSGK